MFLFKQVLAVVCHIMNAFTNLLVGIHRSKSALVARLPTLPSNILDLLLRSVGEVTRVGVIRHGDMYKVCRVVKSMECYVIDLINWNTAAEIHCVFMCDAKLDLFHEQVLLKPL
jgi:hypothetical protein